MSKTPQHVHKLKRHKYKSGAITFFCALSDCSFKVAPALALGKKTQCWRCGETFVLGDYAIRLAKPHCDNCHKPKVDKTQHTLDEYSIDHTKFALEPVITSPVISDLKSRLSGLMQKQDDGGDI